MRSGGWKQRRRWAVRVAAALLAGAVIFYAFVLPTVVEMLVTASLRSRGFSQASVEVRSASWRRVELEHLHLDEAGRFTIDDINVTFSPRRLFAGRITTVELRGLTYHIGLEDGLDLGPIGKLLERTAGRRTGEAKTRRGDPPLDELSLEASTLVIHEGGEVWRIPVGGRVVRDGDALRGELRLRTPLQPLRLTGAFHPSRGAGEARLTAMPPDAEAGNSGRSNPPLELRLAYEPEAGAGSLRLALTGSLSRLEHRWAGRGWHVERVQGSGSAQLRLGSSAELLRSDLQLLIEGLDVDGQRLRRAAGQLARDAEADRATLRLTGEGEGGSLDRFEAKLPVTAEALLRRPMSVPMTWDARLEAAPRQAVRATGAATFTWAKPGEAPTWRATLDELRLAGASRGQSAAWGLSIAGASGEITSRGEADFTADAVRFADLDLEVPQLQAEASLALPGRGDAAEGEPRNRLELRHQAIVLRNVKLPGFTARIEERNGTLTLDAEPSLGSGEAKLTAVGTAAFERGTLRGKVELEATPFAIRTGDPLHRLLGRFAPIDATGRVRLGGDVRFGPGGIEPDLTANLTGATLARPSRGDAERPQVLKGVTAEIHLTGLAPLTTPPGQFVAWEGGRLGNLELDRGEVRFQLEPSNLAFLERAKLAFGNLGTLRVFGLRREPNPRVHTFEVFVEELQLDEAIRLVADDRFSGEGELFGRLQARLDLGPPWTLHLGKGQLTAKPGGTIRIKQAAQAEEILAANLPEIDLESEGMSPGQAKRILIEALQNFRYDRLRIGFVPRGEELDLRVSASGTGVGEIDVPVSEVTVNVRNFGALLDRAVKLQAGLGQKVEWSTDTIDQEFEQTSGDRAIMELFE